MIEVIRGRIWRLGDSINTDLIVPSRVLTEPDKEKLLSATLEVPLPNFAQNVQKGDIIVGGKDFGCGSSREEAVYVLKELGIVAIVAESFSRIYYRNCINLGLPPIVIDDDLDALGNQGETIEINFTNGIVHNLKGERIYRFKPFPPFIKKILDAGGMIPFLQKSRNK